MAQVRGLGKGLSALLSEEEYEDAPIAAAAAPRAAVPAEAGEGGGQMLAIRQIRPGKFQPRQHFNETQLQELTDSIRKNGVIQPIIVRPSGEGDHYDIIAGERRWRAATLAGVEMVPVIIRDVPDQLALELALVENVQRQDLSPLEEAAGYHRLIDEFNYTQENLAITVGKSRSHITNLLRLLTLPESLKRMLEEGGLTMGHARALLGAPDAEGLAKIVAAKGLSVRQTEDLVRASLSAPKQSRPRAKSPAVQVRTTVESVRVKDDDILALEATLSENLGLKVSINDRGQQGEIVIAYSNLSELDGILRRLGGGV